MGKLECIETGIYRTATGYQIKVTVKGVAFNDFVKGHDSLTEARKVKALAVASLEKGLVPDKEDMEGLSNKSFDAAFEDTWKHKWRKTSEGYQKQLLMNWKGVRKFFVKERGITRIDQLTTQHVDDFIYYLSFELGNSESTINNKLCLLSAMCNRMMRIGVLQTSPVIEWQDDDKERLRYYTREEEEEIYELTDLIHFYDTAINTKLKDFIKVLFATGMRPWMEARNMQVSWVRSDMRGNTVIRIPSKYSKTNKERSVPIMGDALESLLRQSEGLDKQDVIFKGLDLKWHCQRFWHEVVRPNMGWGEEEVWYCIRHTFATRLCEAGVNLKVVQELMGHSNINQTAKYAKATDLAKADAIRQLYGRTEVSIGANQTTYQTI